MNWTQRSLLWFISSSNPFYSALSIQSLTTMWLLDVIWMLFFFWSGLPVVLSWSPFLETWLLRQSKVVIRPEQSEERGELSALSLTDCRVAAHWRALLWTPNSPPRHCHILRLFLCLMYTHYSCKHVFIQLYTVHFLTCAKHNDFHFSHTNSFIMLLSLVVWGLESLILIWTCSVFKLN